MTLPSTTARLTGLLIAAATMAFTARVAEATATFMVDTTVDLPDVDTSDGVCRAGNGLCSLRAAVMQANALVTPGAITIQLPAGILTLTIPPSGSDADAATGDLDIEGPLASDQDLQIVGVDSLNPTPGVATIIDANHLDRAFHVLPGRNVVFGALTIRNGAPTNGPGGAIENSGSFVQLYGVKLVGNRAGDGGGLFSSGPLEIHWSTVAGNHADLRGGGVALAPTSNSAILSTTISGNDANEGGGMYVYASGPGSGGVDIENSTIDGNVAAGDGGGVNARSYTRLLNATVSSNDANHAGSGGEGGGLAAPGVDPPLLAVQNSILAGNTRHGTPDSECSGPVAFYGRNLVPNTSAPGCIPTVTPLDHITLATLAPLADNQSPFNQTRALLPGSEAIDAGVDECPDRAGEPLLVDQRYSYRPIHLHCDVGAFEAGSITLDVLFINGFGHPN